MRIVGCGDPQSVAHNRARTYTFGLSQIVFVCRFFVSFPPLIMRDRSLLSCIVCMRSSTARTSVNYRRCHDVVIISVRFSVALFLPPPSTMKVVSHACIYLH